MSNLEAIDNDDIGIFTRKIILPQFLTMPTSEQLFVYFAIMRNPWGSHAIHRDIGVGKLQLLKMIYISLKLINLCPSN